MVLQPNQGINTTICRSSQNHCYETVIVLQPNQCIITTICRSRKNHCYVMTRWWLMKLWWFSNPISVSTRQYVDQVHVRTTVMKRWWFSNPISILTKRIYRSSKNDCYETPMVLQLSQCVNTTICRSSTSTNHCNKTVMVLQPNQYINKENI